MSENLIESTTGETMEAWEARTRSEHAKFMAWLAREYPGANHALSAALARAWIASRTSQMGEV